jgi:hypothetical protein
MNNIARQLIIDKMRESYPQDYDKCIRLSEPPLTDLSVLPQVLEIIKRSYPFVPENSPFIVAIIALLYHPAGLVHKTTARMQIGIREQVANGFGWRDKPVWNFYLLIARSYYKGTRWKFKADMMAKHILNELKS